MVEHISVVSEEQGSVRIFRQKPAVFTKGAHRQRLPAGRDARNIDPIVKLHHRRSMTGQRGRAANVARDIPVALVVEQDPKVGIYSFCRSY